MKGKAEGAGDLDAEVKAGLTFAVGYVCYGCGRESRAAGHFTEGPSAFLELVVEPGGKCSCHGSHYTLTDALWNVQKIKCP